MEAPRARRPSTLVLGRQAPRCRLPFYNLSNKSDGPHARLTALRDAPNKALYTIVRLCCLLRALRARQNNLQMLQMPQLG